LKVVRKVVPKPDLELEVSTIIINLFIDYADSLTEHFDVIMRHAEALS